MNKVNAVEKIRDLHGSVGATLALNAGMTVNLASYTVVLVPLHRPTHQLAKHLQLQV